MFRSLERLGIYSHGNMNKLSLQVWNEYELKEIFKQWCLSWYSSYKWISAFNSIARFNCRNASWYGRIQIVNPDYISIVVDDEDTTALIFSYKKWNKLLIDYFFQLKNEGKKSHAFYMKNCLMKFQTSIYTQISIINRKELRSKLFANKFIELYQLSSLV
jgi:hypothetical protein